MHSEDFGNAGYAARIAGEIPRKMGRNAAGEKGANQLLWGVGEIGEVIDIIKKRGADEIMRDPVTRAHFVEEMSDVFMYLCDVMLCYGITAGEYSETHAQKHAHNMKRDYVSENRRLFDK